MSVQRTVTTALLLISSIMGSSAAYAQSAPDPQSAPDAPVDAGAAGEGPVADAGTECPLHEHYDRAFVLYADGAYVEAQALLEEVLAACPDYRGVAGAVLTSDGSDFAQHVGAWSAILLPVGFGVTMWLTASLDVPDEVADHVSIAPAGPGDGPGLTVSVRF